MSNQFSHSKIDAFRVCPRKYQFQYIERPQIEKQVAVEVFTGQVLHQVLQQVYEVRRMNKALPREDALALYDRGWEGAPLKALKVNNESLAVEDFIEDGRRSLEWYYDEHQPFDDGETLGVEEWVRLQIDPARDLNLRGKIDRLCRHSDGS
ncbi:MAG TPA: PD-(D/E)XK nuclease family protein, partial [candidate division Zixibacteria bacterium]|nr:PD-(D/E)XK nuclease family protein [candidate division Zixibacteria bacterium]